MRRFNCLKQVQHFDAHNFIKTKIERKKIQFITFWNSWNISKDFEKLTSVT